MRRGIGLRAYSQRDPLNEFKVEAYRMFDELKSTIRHDVTHTIFRVTVTREPHQHQHRRRDAVTERQRCPRRYGRTNRPAAVRRRLRHRR